jgi:hypothetical protein
MYSKLEAEALKREEGAKERLKQERDGQIEMVISRLQKESDEAKVCSIKLLNYFYYILIFFTTIAHPILVQVSIG